MLQGHYLSILKHLELLKEDTMQRLYEYGWFDDDENDENINPANPLATATPLLINGYSVFQFSYDGMLPVYQQDRDYIRHIRSYYNRVTYMSYDYSQMNHTIDKSMMVICHYFKDNTIRDLDNRNRKYIIDAIRNTQLMGDDCWQNLSILEKGYLDNRNHVQVFLVDDDNKIDFLTYLEQHHHDLKKYPEVSNR